MVLGDTGSPNQLSCGFYGNHGAKGTIYDRGTRLPLVVTGPAIALGHTNAFGYTTDLYATILGLAGASDDTPNSINFTPVLHGKDGDCDFVYVEQFSERPALGARILWLGAASGRLQIRKPRMCPATVVYS